VHLFGGRKRTLVHDIKPMLAGVHPLPLGKLRLQGHGLDPGLGELLRRVGRGRKAFDPIPRGLRSLAHDGQRRRLERSFLSRKTTDTTRFFCLMNPCRDSRPKISNGDSQGERRPEVSAAWPPPKAHYEESLFQLELDHNCPSYRV